ncbi:MAG: hypothetical protein QM756_15545 [Polyangiaceae bacterium]
MHKLSLVGVGVVAGLATSMLINRWLIRDSLAAMKVVDVAPADASARAGLRALGGEVQRLSVRVDALPSEPAAQHENDANAEGVDATSGVEASGVASAPAERLPEPESVSADVAVREFEQVEAHAAQAVDPSWAPRARADFQADFARFGAPLGASVSDVDCRTRDCKVKLTWPSYEKAAAGYRELMSSEFAQNCGFFARLPEAEQAGAYSHDVLLHCR